MIEGSQYLINFLDTNVIHRLSCFKKNKLSESSTNLLYNLFQKLITSSARAKEVEIKYSTINKNDVLGQSYQLCPLHIKTHIDKMDSEARLYQFKLHDRNIKVVMVNEKNNKDTKFLTDAINKIYLWLHFAQQFANMECSQTLDIYFYFTDIEKTLPALKDEIGHENANTAFTFSCKPKNEIYVYRKEEWFKVFMHECFHNLGFDFSEIECSHIDKQILSMFPVKADVRLFETYCEIWAELFNVMFIVFYSTKKSKDDENLAIMKMIKRTEKMLHYERMFSLFQCAKILNFFGLSYTELYDKDIRSQQIRNLRYKETTPILSYYIIKCVLIYNINDFLEWCILHNGYSINFNKEKHKVHNNLNNYCQLIREHYMDEIFIDCLNDLEKWFKKQIKTNRMNKSELITLRMSLYET